MMMCIGQSCACNVWNGVHQTKIANSKCIVHQIQILIGFYEHCIHTSSWWGKCSDHRAMVEHHMEWQETRWVLCQWCSLMTAWQLIAMSLRFGTCHSPLSNWGAWCFSRIMWSTYHTCFCRMALSYGCINLAGLLASQTGCLFYLQSKMVRNQLKT